MLEELHVITYQALKLVHLFLGEGISSLRKSYGSFSFCGEASVSVSSKQKSRENEKLLFRKSSKPVFSPLEKKDIKLN